MLNAPCDGLCGLCPRGTGQLDGGHIQLIGANNSSVTLQVNEVSGRRTVAVLKLHQLGWPPG